MKYRPEIDGLRALAVLPVVFFHAGFDLFSGGYVGVDVFFVISGYLITSIIVEQIADGSFSIIKFYERRARRILPALFFVIIVSIPFAIFLLPPYDFTDFAQSVFAVSLFSSNILFWIKSGYFDTVAELKPLLHTWSLAVEEQYYILFPLMLLVMWKYESKRIILLLSAIAIFSIILSQWAAYNKPIANFYLLPTRAWELLLGSFVPLYIYKNDFEKYPINIKRILSFFGLSLLLFSFFVFDHSTPFPSFYALLPTVGTLLIIVFAVEGTLVHKILSNRIAVGVGLISYSVYLWHQPIFAYLRHYLLTDISNIQKLIFSCAAIGIGYLSWRFIERPFRTPGIISRGKLFATAAILTAAFLCFGLYGHLTYAPIQGLQIAGQQIPLPDKFLGVVVGEKNCTYPLRFPEDVCRVEGKRPIDQSNISLFVIGDSHARVLTEAVVENKTFYNNFYDLTASGCPPLLGLTRFDKGGVAGDCQPEYQQNRINFLAKTATKNSVAILYARWPQYYYGDGFDNTVGGEEIKTVILGKSPDLARQVMMEDFLMSFRNTVKEVSDIVDLVIIIGPNHANGWNIIDYALLKAPKLRNTKELEEILTIPAAPINQRVQFFYELVGNITKDNNKIAVLDPRKYTCSEEKQSCYGFKDGKILFTDSNHMSIHANRPLIADVAAIINSKFK